MTLTTAVHSELLRLEADLAATPNAGTSAYALHAHDMDAYHDLAIERLGDGQWLDVADDLLAEWCSGISPMPPCYHGLAVAFERLNVRYLICALRGGITVIVERPPRETLPWIHPAKPRCFIVPPERIVVGPACDVANALQQVVMHSAPVRRPTEDLPPFVRQIAEKLGLDPEGFGGIVIIGGQD